MELFEKKKLILNDHDLRIIKDIAHSNFINLAPDPRMETESFTTYCWTKAALDFMNGKGYFNFDVHIRKK